MTLTLSEKRLRKILEAIGYASSAAEAMGEDSSGRWFEELAGVLLQQVVKPGEKKWLLHFLLKGTQDGARDVAAACDRARQPRPRPAALETGTGKCETRGA